MKSQISIALGRKNAINSIIEFVFSHRTNRFHNARSAQWVVLFKPLWKQLLQLVR